MFGRSFVLLWIFHFVVYGYPIGMMLKTLKTLAHSAQLFNNQTIFLDQVAKESNIVVEKCRLVAKLKLKI